MASSSDCSSCGQNPCGHLSEELERLLPCLELSILPPTSAGREARAVPETGQDQGKLGRSTAVALTPCQGNPSALSQAEVHSFPRVSLGALTHSLIADVSC